MRNLLVCLVVAVGLAGCSWFTHEATLVGKGAVNCAATEVQVALKQYGPPVEAALVESLDAAGKADWSKIDAATSSLTAPDLKPNLRAVGGCVVSKVIERVIANAAKLGGAMSAGVPVDAESLRGPWEVRLRERFGDTRFEGVQ